MDQFAFHGPVLFFSMWIKSNVVELTVFGIIASGCIGSDSLLGYNVKAQKLPELRIVIVKFRCTLRPHVYRVWTKRFVSFNRICVLILVTLYSIGLF